MLSLITLSITVNIAMLRVHNFPHNADYRNAECHWGVPQCCGELHSVLSKKCYTKCHDFAHNAKCYHAGYH